MRLAVFGDDERQHLRFRDMLSPGRVTIVDLSDTDSPQVNNLVIAELLRGVQHAQERNYREAAAEGAAPTPASIFIEEAHEFLSVQRVKHMPVIFQQVARIARRSRKRWLGLVFITQLPQHLPDEVLSLMNNHVIHKISDGAVVDRLRRSIGGIHDSMWRQLPALAPGQAIAAFSSQTRPVLTSVDPAPCKLLMVE